MRNLHTGRGSRQCHVVSDDKFQTVFNEGRSNEEIDQSCETLLEGNRECYVKEEYNQYGVLNYEPPPLDKVWLSKTKN